jgi:hypothetical protein
MSVALPVLPDSFLGWIPALYRITEQQVLASAGLDAFVFLSFFKMSMRLFATLFFFAAVVLEPINQRFLHSPTSNVTDGSYLSNIWRSPQTTIFHNAAIPQWTLAEDDPDDGGPDNSFAPGMGYLWAYLVFTYFFTLLTLYFMNSETLKILRVRQEYLGTQSTVTDRTFQLSGIPTEIRTDAKIKQLVEKLEIGRVESVTLCRKWGPLDNLIQQREVVLRKLEETWSIYLAQNPVHPVGTEAPADGNPGNTADEESGENQRLLADSSGDQFAERQRPQTRLWYGFMRLQSRQTDGIDYYEEKLRRLDEKIHAARQNTYEPADLAFVTMDSMAACQMAIQALIDPHPGQLLTKPAPAPSDVVWSNTYTSRLQRQFQSWTTTIFVVVLSVLWLIPVAFLASILSLCTISKVFPDFAESLKAHHIIKALVQTGLPTAVVSLLNIAVPYLYDYLSYHQGMRSRGDVALSVISKVFFFTFFNIFLVFTVFGTVSSIIPVLREGLRDTTSIASTLATKIQNLSVFYLNFIMLQGLGLFPFRLLEFGSVAMYPFYRMTAKTPRDHAEIAEPPVFNYAFYLPTALLVFILCLVYSAMPGGFMVLLLGLVYFLLGHFTYKYQLLYAMEQPQHATGGAWRIICYRIVLGLVVFQLTMSGVLALRKAFIEASLLIPLLVGTLWYGYHFRHRFEPLTRFISLRSIKRNGDIHGDNAVAGEGPARATEREGVLLRRTSTVDEDKERGLKFVNPSLIVP